MIDYTSLVLAIILLIGGGLVLAAGAELLVRGASRLALAWGVTPMVIGLTVVAFGTSTPELATSVIAQAGGKGGIALANIFGSNIANIGLILALAGILKPLPVQGVTIRRDLPLLILVTIGFSAVLLFRPAVGWIEGAALLGGLVLFTIFQVRCALRDRRAVEEQYAEAVEPKGRTWSFPQCAAAIVAGFVLLVLGGDLLVDGAVTIARRLGLSERVIGLTVVAVGTSLPELAASVAAVVKGEVDVAVGNVIGSNFLNILGIGGSIAVFSPVAVPAGMLHIDVPVLVGTTLLASMFLWTGRIFSRFEGFFLLVCYGAYIYFLF